MHTEDRAIAPLEELRAAVLAAATAVRGSEGELAAAPRLERPKHEGQGDYSTNAAMLLAPVLGSSPRQIAELLGAKLAERLGSSLERTEIAGPGFLNLFLSDEWHRRALSGVLAAGDRFGRGGAAPAERILVEFVSANPTGPLVAASGRHAAYGDALARIRATLERYGVEFDSFFSEATLHEGSPNQLERALAELDQAGHLYRSDGALWLRTSTFGDDKDRVLERQNGEPTYFAADVAYMQNKRERGFERQLNPMGADHHGYVARLKAAFAALGGDPELLEVPILQFVHLVEGQERAAMSKRRGDFVTLDELLDEIGVDAARFFMLQRSHDRTLDLDLNLARSQSRENPVYYVQYAHARIASMLARAGDPRVQAAVDGNADWGDGELHSAERGLVKKLAAFPEEVVEAADRRAPHRIAVYSLELAQDFTAFYTDCHVVGAEPKAVESFRMALSVAARTVIARSLQLLGVSAPDSM